MSDGIVEKISKITGDGKEQSSIKQAIPNQDHFEALMQQSTEAAKLKVEDINVGEQNSPMDELRNANHTAVYAQISPEGLIAQAQNVITQIDSIKQGLSTPNLELKDSVQNLLKNKLEHVDENLKVALEKMGSEYQQAPALSGVGTPIERFIGFLTHSQYNLDRVANDVQALSGKDLAPASLLAIQIKVNYVQQELEFFTSLLNKALESTKTVMNVQV